MSWAPTGESLAARAMRAQASGRFTCETLGEFNGDFCPPYVGVCGLVYDVGDSANFDKEDDSVGHGYGALWAGKDATFALAKLSLRPEDANRVDWALEDLSGDELAVLGAWAAHFSARYKEPFTEEALMAAFDAGYLSDSCKKRVPETVKEVGLLVEYAGWDWEPAREAAKGRAPPLERLVQLQEEQGHAVVPAPAAVAE
uniref:Cytochrome b5 heme-binding domain-containing protein n=1 Tax=Alexandrium monilatum TaxID=311494 RepID=A0A7S4PUT4_9DINO